MAILRQIYDYAFGSDPASATRSLHSALQLTGDSALPRDYMELVDAHWTGRNG